MPGFTRDIRSTTAPFLRALLGGDLDQHARAGFSGELGFPQPAEGLGAIGHGRCTLDDLQLSL
ncbi:hypothetical protein [Mycolicibacterium smegmatis]|uniref:hypothetical protein n=1 Tax=Mycolicibacterium smegmatis TaxID=1772 RepID=UPI001EFB79CD|nr:hypothetical protein [Mycolicibacterium smegmatis]ULN34184.1 hypothetical protein KZ781_25930 [Mycolicibacterium smegmatis]